MSALMSRLKKHSRTKRAEILDDSTIFKSRVMVPTPVPMINVALSGELDGGMLSGLLMLAGPSKHFKTSFMLLMAASYMKKYPDAVMLFYDSEFGSPASYFKTFGIDTSRVFHTPITNVENLKLDVIGQLEALEAGDRVIICIDSVGNTASAKELQDAIDEKSVTDMSRAKALKGMFRMVTPYLILKDIPMIAVNHTYANMTGHGQTVSGGTGIYYSANDIWIIGRRQDKDGDNLTGYEFVINIEKSRSVKEKSKIPIAVSFDGGIQRWSGLMEVAMAGGYVTKPKVGWYAWTDPKTGEVLSEKNYRLKDTMTEAFWNPIFETTDFPKFVKSHFTLGIASMLGEGTDVTEVQLEEVDDVSAESEDQEG